MKPPPSRLSTAVMAAAAYVPIFGNLITAGAGAALFAIVHRGRMPTFRRVAVPASLAALAVVSFLVSALANQVSVAERGTLASALIGLFVLGIASHTELRERALLLLFLCLSVAWALRSLFAGSELTALGPSALWKYGLAVPVTFGLLCLLLCMRAPSFWIGLVLAGVGLASLVLNFRSHAAICLLAAGIIAATQRKIFFPNSKIATLALVFIFLTPVLFLPALIADGVFGPEVQTKMLSQSAGEGPLLLAGRNEPPLSIAIVSMSPVFGWGQISNVPSEAITRGLEIASALGMSDHTLYVRNWLRTGEGPALHSVAAQAWTEGGAGAALLFIWIIFAGIRAALLAGGWIRPLVVLAAVQCGWDTLFSPLSMEMIPMWGAFAVLFCKFQDRQHAEADTLNVPRQDQVVDATSTAGPGGRL